MARGQAVEKRRSLNEEESAGAKLTYPCSKPKGARIGLLQACSSVRCAYSFASLTRVGTTPSIVR